MQCRFRVVGEGDFLDENIELEQLGNLLIKHPVIVEVIGEYVRMLAFNDIDKRRLTFQFRSIDDPQPDEDFFNSL